MSRKISLFIILISLFTFFLVGFIHPLNAITQDLGRHFLLGKIIWQTHTIPSTNLLSYTYPDFPFINHHWLSEVLFYLISNTFGFSFLGALMVLFAGASVGILMWFMYKEKFHPLVIGTVGFIGLQILFERTDTRPEIFGWFLLSLLLIILYSYREKYTRWIFILPFLQLLWVNLHITFLVGLIIQGAFFLDLLITYRKDFFNKRVKILFLICILSGLACLLNPQGIKGALYPLTVFNNYGYSIEENQNIFFLQTIENKLTIKYFYVYTFLLFGGLLLTFKRSRVSDWLLSISFTILGIYAIRNFPLFVLVTLIPGVRSLSFLFENWKTNSHLFRRYGEYSLWILFVGMFCLSIFQLSPKVHISLSVPQTLAKGTDFFRNEHLSGPIFNNFDIGSFLEYQLYPEEKMFIDGRPEAFPTQFIQGVYIPMQQSPVVFETVDQRYHFNTIIFSHTDQTPWAQTFVTSIVQNATWKLVYLNQEVMILVKNTPSNQSLITKYAKSLTTIPVDSDGTFDANLRLLRFFSMTNTLPRTIEYAKKVLDQNPNYCPAIGILNQIYTTEQNPTASLYQYQYMQKCQ